MNELSQLIICERAELSYTASSLYSRDYVTTYKAFNNPIKLVAIIMFILYL